MADLRGKTFLNQNLALSGKVNYESLGSGSFGALGQAEYLFSENWMGNAGLNYANSSTSLLLGADLPPETWRLGDGYYLTICRNLIHPFCQNSCREKENKHEIVKLSIDNILRIVKMAYLNCL